MKDEMDILKEMGNTAAAHGSTALSEMLGRKINLYAPSVRIVHPSELAETIKIEGTAIVLRTQLLSGIKNEAYSSYWTKKALIN